MIYASWLLDGSILFVGVLDVLPLTLATLFLMSDPGW